MIMKSLKIPNERDNSKCLYVKDIYPPFFPMIKRARDTDFIFSTSHNLKSVKK